MRGRPPRRELTEEQARAAQAFVSSAEESTKLIEDAEENSAPRHPDGRGEQDDRDRGEGGGRNLEKNLAGEATPYLEKKYPWQQDYVREDVTKGYALRLPEPLYLKLKYVSKQTRISMNELINGAVESIVQENLKQLP